MKKRTHAAVVLVVVLLAGSLGCTRTVRMPGPYGEDAFGQKGVAYVFTMGDGESITTDLFTVTDSSVVIDAVIENGRREGRESREIVFSDLRAVSRIEISSVRTGAVVGASVVALAALAAAVASSLAGQAGN